MNSSKNHERAPGMVQTSIAVPEELLERLTAAARIQRRSRNNLIALWLWEAVEKHPLAVTEAPAPEQKPVEHPDAGPYKRAAKKKETKA